MLNARRPQKWFSLLRLRIWVIVIFPSVMFYIGLVSIDQYRLTVINSEIDALYRQGHTLARSIGLTDSQHSTLARRKLSQLTMQRATQLIASIPDARIRIFQPDGKLISDSALAGILSPPQITLSQRAQNKSQSLTETFRYVAGKIADWLTPADRYPLYNEKTIQKANDYSAVMKALDGEPASLIMRNRKNEMIIGVAVPIRHLRVVRGALFVTASGEAVERDIRAVEHTFLLIFLGIMAITMALGYYLAQSIINPIGRLARAADAVRLSKGTSFSLPKMIGRRDEIGDLARDLAAMTDELQMRMQATASFAADVAHEIKNPLTSLRSAVETVARIKDKKQQRQLMNIILDDVQRLDRLISDISVASRIDVDLTAAAFERIDLAALVRNFAQARSHTSQKAPAGQKAQAGQKAKAIKFKILVPDEPVIVDAIIDRLVQVLDNLYVNALSFSPEGGVITFALVVDKEQGVLTIQDEGPGIPPDKTDAIFSRFYTERPENERFGRHSGLGLSISRKIIEAHGGTLTADNYTDASKGKTGAVLKVILPTNPDKSSFSKDSF